ncbi:hypothetical protein K490DRAFT_55153 [Saccharata proteae CBS 121410]|uniref:Uncharacterized protein n=1 Tax=Saccharata proteae CBS 121410 TaxID=1314787 RepID=A0A6A5YF60_9PEZI|nr:hypothetical protein K490DRAFT_55153 [Saccharata proteae CBS 121410]
MALRSTAGSLAMLGLFVRGVLSDCESYGMDFQNKGSYFQNSLSTDNFTFVSQFEGCESDAVAFNYIVDPNGDQTQCSNTPMSPDDVNELSTCPLMKDQLSGGAWSILVLSNNGDNGAPVAYERDFSLSVGPQSTSTSLQLLFPCQSITVTVASTSVQKTITSTPKAVTITKDINFATLTIPKYTLSISKVVVTKTASCKLPIRQAWADPTAQVVITTGSGTSVPTATPTAVKYRMLRDTDPRPDTDLKRFLKERAERLSAHGDLEKRAPDPQPLIVTDSNTADWSTVFVTSTAATSTMTVFSTITSTQTITPSPVTVMSGWTVLSPKTITAATPTKTKSEYGIAWITSTKTQHLTYTITSTTTPAAVKSACMHSGGVLYRKFRKGRW